MACWLRKGTSPSESLVFIANFTPLVRKNYRIGVPKLGFYTELINTDNLKYGGSDQLNTGLIETAPIPFHNKTHSLSLKLPPLGLVILKYDHNYEWYEEAPFNAILPGSAAGPKSKADLLIRAHNSLP